MITCIICGKEMVNNGYVRHLREAKHCKKLQIKAGFIRGDDEDELDFFNRIRGINQNKEEEEEVKPVKKLNKKKEDVKEIDIEINERPILEDDREIIVKDASVQTEDVVIISIDEFNEFRKFKEQKEKKINEIKKMMLEMNINENDLI